MHKILPVRTTDLALQFCYLKVIARVFLSHIGIKFALVICSSRVITSTNNYIPINVKYRREISIFPWAKSDALFYSFTFLLFYSRSRYCRQTFSSFLILTPASSIQKWMGNQASILKNKNFKNLGMKSFHVFWFILEECN